MFHLTSGNTRNYSLTHIVDNSFSLSVTVCHHFHYWDKPELNVSSTVEGFLKCHSERGDERLGLTDSHCSHHRGHDDGESHSAGDHQVPLVVGDVFAFVAVVDLMEGRRAK